MWHGGRGARVPGVAAGRPAGDGPAAGRRTPPRPAGAPRRAPHPRSAGPRERRPGGRRQVAAPGSRARVGRAPAGRSTSRGAALPAGRIRGHHDRTAADRRSGGTAGGPPVDARRDRHTAERRQDHADPAGRRRGDRAGRHPRVGKRRTAVPMAGYRVAPGRTRRTGPDRRRRRSPVGHRRAVRRTTAEPVDPRVARAARPGDRARRAGHPDAGVPRPRGRPGTAAEDPHDRRIRPTIRRARTTDRRVDRSCAARRTDRRRDHRALIGQGRHRHRRRPR